MKHDMLASTSRFLHVDPPPRAAFDVSDGNGTSLEGRVVAIIDDDAAVRDSTRLLLEIHDVRVETYQSGGEFLAKKPEVACLIVDYQMPDLDGLELIAEARTQGCAPRRS